MPNPPPNHAPTQTLNIAQPAIGTPDDCEALKAEFGIKTNTHSKNTRGPAKGTSRAQGLQSHHILQDAQTDSLISRGRAIAVILQDSTSGSEHGTITARQNARMNSKGGAGGPAATFGALKKEARDDLVAGLQGKRKSNKTGKPMTKAQAEKLADCLVAEAEDAVKEEVNKDPNAAPVTDATGVPPPAGCLTAGTLVWLADGEQRLVEALVPGDMLWTPVGGAALVRVDTCVHDIVELEIGDTTLRIATYHPLVGRDGRSRRADSYAVGERLRTTAGLRAIGARRLLARATTYRLGLAGDATCAVGSAGVWAAMTDTGPVVLRTELIHPAGEEPSCLS